MTRLKRAIFGFFVLTLYALQMFGQQVISTVAGTDWVFLDNGKPAVNAGIGHIAGIAVDSSNNTYIADPNNNLIFRVDPSGVLTIVAGNGIAAFSGDGGLATTASLNGPVDVAVDPSGNLYIADNNNRRIRKVDKATSFITTFAGNGLAPDPANPNLGQQDNIPALQASFAPIGLFIDGKGIVYLGDGDHYKVRKIGLDGRISTVAGNGPEDFDGDNQPATGASLKFPRSIAVDAGGNVYIADSFHFRVRKVDTNGVITTVMGSSKQGNSPAADGTLAADALLNIPFAIAIGPNGDIYVGDIGYQVVQVISATTKTVRTVAGTGKTGFSGDGGPPKAAMLSGPGSLAFDSSGNLLIADGQNSRVRRILGNTINTVAGNGQYKQFSNPGPALQAFLSQPQGLSFDTAGNLYVADTQNNRVEQITPDGTITTVAGTGDFDYYGDGGPATAAALAEPRDVAVDSAGNLYIADAHSTRVRRVAADGKISSIACGQLLVICGPLVDPRGLAIAPDGSVYVADGAGNAIRQIHTDLTVTDFVGSGNPDCNGDEGPALQACVKNAHGVALDLQGNVYIADTGHNTIRQVTTDLKIHTIAGNGQAQYAGDGGPALRASLNGPTKIALGSDGSLYIADTGNHVVRVVTPDGTITSLAGTAMPGFSGDGGLATSALLHSPAGVSTDLKGNVYVSDTLNDRIRVVSRSTPLFAPPFAGSGGLSFDATSGDPPTAPQTLSIALTTDAVNSTLPFSVATDVNWLRIVPTMGMTPATLQVAADPRQLAPDSYKGTITITAPGFPAVKPVQVPVAFNVHRPGSGLGSLALDTTDISLALTQQSPTAMVFVQAAITTQGTGFSSVPVSATTSGEPWLKISLSSPNAEPGNPAIITVRVDLTGFPAGTYRAALTITTPPLSVYTIPITVALSGPRASLALSRDSVTFTAVAGGATVLPPQSFAVLNQGSGAIAWSLTKCTAAGICDASAAPDWLIFDKTSGTSGPVASRVQVSADPSKLAAGDPSKLAPGRYAALVQVSADALNSPRFVSVTLNVVKPEADPGPAVTPSGLVFQANNGTTPGSQSIFAYNLGTKPLMFNLFGGTLDGGNWLVFKVPKPPLIPGQPLEVTVQTDPTQLQPGVYRAALTFLFQTGDIRNVLVTLFVGAAASGSSGNTSLAFSKASGCVPDTTLQPVITMLGTGTRIPAGVPAVIDSLVTDQSGCALLTGNVAAQISDSSGAASQVTLNSLGDGTWEGVWEPKTAGSDSLTVAAADRTLMVSGMSDTRSADVGDPLDGALAVSNVASTASQLPGPVAPGSLITVFGKNLGPRGQPMTAALPWNTQLGGVTVRLGGNLLPIFYVSQDVLNTIVPFGVQSGTTPQLIIAYRDSVGVDNLSVLPVPVSVTDAQPAIYTQDLSGKGLGQISNANGPISTNNPAHSSDNITIACTGLGAVTPQVAAGVAVPASQTYAVVQPVMVRINGALATNVSASLVPGASGDYKVVATVPPLGPGTYDLTVTASSSTSPPVQIIIQ